MSKNSRRGYTEEDEKLFSGRYYINLCKAAKDLRYLLDSDYPIKTASTFIANHYMFTERQRLTITRSVCSSQSASLRQEKLLTNTYLIPEVNIDGFNTVITLEVALSNAPVLKCMDSTMRDLAGLRGTYRIIDKTVIAIHAIFQWLVQMKIRRVNIYLDAPVSNSGRLKVLFCTISKEYPVELRVEIINEVDQTLEQAEYVITTDAIILERCKTWINMNREIINNMREDTWIVDLSKE